MKRLLTIQGRACLKRYLRYSYNKPLGYSEIPHWMIAAAVLIGASIPFVIILFI